jgi:uncharacterized glyoxalase superfamily protein PhnB
MIVNRSVPSSTVIPVLPYSDVRKASTWLCDAFGFTQRLRIGDHRAQLVFGDGGVILTARAEGVHDAQDSAPHTVHVRVEDADRHHDQAKACGARILQPPTDYPFGERQYTVEDLGGHHWTFSQSIADVDPVSWGATEIDIDPS